MHVKIFFGRDGVRHGGASPGLVVPCVGSQWVSGWPMKGHTTRRAAEPRAQTQSMPLAVMPAICGIVGIVESELEKLLVGGGIHEGRGGASRGLSIPCTLHLLGSSPAPSSSV